MSDIIARAQKSSAIINDRSLQQFERVWPALKALSGLIVSDLADVPRAAIEAQMVAINHISANHTIESEDDYKQLTDEEAEEILSRIGTVNQLCIDSEAGRIMHELVSAEQKLPEAAIEEVRQHRDIFVPLLMRHLEQTVTSVRNGEEIEENASFFALFLLSELQVDDAFPIILDALRLPEDAAFELFGDAVHEITPRLLAQFSHGKVDAIDQIIRDSNSTIYVRWSAAQAYTFLVRDGLISRQFAVDALHAHFQHCMENQEYFLLAPLACVLGDLAAESALETIRLAYERKLVEEAIVDLGFIESQIAGGEETIKQTFERCRPSGIADTIAELRSWAAFQEQPTRPPSKPIATKATLPSPRRHTNNFDLPSKSATTIRVDAKIGRNDPCPCGSGKKYKKCCGRS